MVTVDSNAAGIGVYVTQDIFLSYEYEFGDQGGNKVKVEYDVTRQLKLEASDGDFGEATVDLFWGRDY